MAYKVLHSFVDVNLKVASFIEDRRLAMLKLPVKKNSNFSSKRSFFTLRVIPKTRNIQKKTRPWTTIFEKCLPLPILSQAPSFRTVLLGSCCLTNTSIHWMASSKHYGHTSDIGQTADTLERQMFA